MKLTPSPLCNYIHTNHHNKIPTTTLQATVFSSATTQNEHGQTIPTWSILPTPNWIDWKYHAHPEGNHGPFRFQGFVITRNGDVYGPIWMQEDKFSSNTPSQSCPNRDCRWWWIYPRNAPEFFRLFKNNIDQVKEIDSILVFL